jgi:small-conductance mechanosensitive channel
MVMPTVSEIETILSHFWDPHSWLGIVFYAALFFIGAMGVSRLIRVSANRIMLRENELVDRTVVMFLTQLAQTATYLIGLIIFFHIVPALNKLGTALLTGVSVVSVVFGLAAQNTLANLVAGCTLLLYRPFHIDDLIQVATPTGTESGIVERLTLGYTMLRTVDDRLVIVPNSLMASQVSLNLNRKSLHTMLVVPVGVADRAKVGDVRAILVDTATHTPGVRKIISCRSQLFEDTGIILSLRAWCSYDAATGKIRETITDALRQKFSENEVFLLASPFPDKAEK